MSFASSWLRRMTAGSMIAAYARLSRPRSRPTPAMSLRCSAQSARHRGASDMDFGAITITGAAGGPRTAALNRATMRIGRAPDNDVVLDDAQVDLQHAEIL